MNLFLDLSHFQNNYFLHYFYPLVVDQVQKSKKVTSAYRALIARVLIGSSQNFGSAQVLQRNTKIVVICML